MPSEKQQLIDLITKLEEQDKLRTKLNKISKIIRETPDNPVKAAESRQIKNNIIMAVQNILYIFCKFLQFIIIYYIINIRNLYCIYNNVMTENSRKPNIFTTKEKGYNKFWEKRIFENNQKTWSSTNINGGYLEKSNAEVKQKSWFKIKEAKNNNYIQHKVAFENVKFDNNAKDDVEDIKIVKVRLKLNMDQKNIIQKWFGVARYVYNLCVDYLTNRLVNYNKHGIKEPISLQLLRETIVGTQNHKPLESWVYECPVDIYGGAVNDALKAYRVVVSNRAKGKKNELNYRKKKDYNSIVIAKKILLRGKLYKLYLGKIDSKISLVSEGDARLSYSKTEGYILHKIVVNKTKEINPLVENQSPTVIALDPGVRTFFTGYSQSLVTDIGKKAAEKLMKLKNAKNSLLNKIKKSENINARKRKRMKLACGKIQKRITGLTDELHWKTINYLMKFNIIILPQFNIKSMIQRVNERTKQTRNINKTTVSRMLLLQHYKFRTRLTNKIKLSKNHKLYIVNEAYTSRTCSDCGVINDKLGSAKVFDCTACSMKLGRDINGARNIYNKYVRVL